MNQDATNQPIAFHNGKFVSDDSLLVRPQDMGFMLGVTVAEQLRTFNGVLTDTKEHFERLRTSLAIIDVDVDVAELVDAAERVAAHNHGLLEPGHDLGVTVFVTPGLYPTYCPDGVSSPTMAVHSYPLPFSLWATKYDQGQVCDFVSVPQVAADCWPRKLKCRSRMHYYLADKEARKVNPASRAILLDEAGNVNEASTANVLAYFENEGLVSPPLDDILPGISLQHTLRLAKKLQIPIHFRPIERDELVTADELMLTSTPYCVLPVCQLGSRDAEVHSFTKRSIYGSLIDAWSEDTGVNVVQQAKEMGA